MHDLNPQSLLARGTKTYEGAHVETTIDLILVSPRLEDNYLQCGIYPTEHGSDHRAITTVLRLDTPRSEPTSRWAFDKAPWAQIRAEITPQLSHLPAVDEDLDGYTQRLIDTISQTISRLVSRQRPSSYCKRWWSSDLTQLRDDYVYWRN